MGGVGGRGRRRGGVGVFTRGGGVGIRIDGEEVVGGVAMLGGVEGGTELSDEPTQWKMCLKS